MLLRCPRQFQHRYLFGEKERPGEAIVIGSFFHETLEWNYRRRSSSHADNPLSDAVQYLQDEAVPKVIEQEGGEDKILWDTGPRRRSLRCGAGHVRLLPTRRAPHPACRSEERVWIESQASRCP